MYVLCEKCLGIGNMSWQDISDPPSGKLKEELVLGPGYFSVLANDVDFIQRGGR